MPSLPHNSDHNPHYHRQLENMGPNQMPSLPHSHDLNPHIHRQLEHMYQMLSWLNNNGGHHPHYHKQFENIWPYQMPLPPPNGGHPPQYHRQFDTFGRNQMPSSPYNGGKHPPYHRQFDNIGPNHMPPPPNNGEHHPPDPQCHQQLDAVADGRHIQPDPPTCGTDPPAGTYVNHTSTAMSTSNENFNIQSKFNRTTGSRFDQAATMHSYTTSRTTTSVTSIISTATNTGTSQNHNDNDIVSGFRHLSLANDSNSTMTAPHNAARSLQGVKRKASVAVYKKVQFAANLEQVFELPMLQDDDNEYSPVEAEDGATNNTSTTTTLKRTRDMTVLSSVHGKARRELREIPLFDLQSAVKHGVISRGHPDPKTGRPRWIYEYGNVVYITDETSTMEVTSYKQAIAIQPATISAEMWDRHWQEKQTLKNDPHLCATHSVIVIDQSESMRTCDVKGFKNRSQAAYGVLALEYIAEQLHQRGDDHGILDAVSVIEMNDSGSVIFSREPMDWILFNKLLDRQVAAKPKSHGNYFHALDVAQYVIRQEIRLVDEDMEPDDLPSYALVFLSDGKPSDHESHWIDAQQEILKGLAKDLKENFSFHAIALGHSSADFQAMRRLATTVEENGSKGTFIFSDLSCMKLSDAFSSIATSVTATRTAMLSSNATPKAPRKEKDVQLRSKHTPRSQRTFQRYNKEISRWVYDENKYKNRNDWPWTEVDFRNSGAIGFDMERHPFGKGAERLAYMFYEIGRDNRRKGKVMVAKETKFVDENDSEVKFHEAFCRTQRLSDDFAKKFNREVAKSPKLRPVESFVKTPAIRFLDCSVYEYRDMYGTKCGVLVEDFLKGKFEKYNSNDGYIKKRSPNDRAIELQVGEVYMTDFVQAFSHWTYVHTDHKLLVCDLQGVLNEEGRHPKFELTDPCICSRKSEKGRKKYGNTNLGLRSLKKFRANHKCNGVCEGLGLPPFGSRHHRSRKESANT